MRYMSWKCKARFYLEIIWNEIHVLFKEMHATFSGKRSTLNSKNRYNRFNKHNMRIMYPYTRTCQPWLRVSIWRSLKHLNNYLLYWSNQANIRSKYCTRGYSLPLGPPSLNWLLSVTTETKVGATSLPSPTKIWSQILYG